MPVDPVLKQDLLLVKEAFESGVATQDGVEESIFPARDVISKQIVFYETVEQGLEQYPSVEHGGRPPSNEERSTFDRLQQECIPCLTRIEYLYDIDLSEDLFDGIVRWDSWVLDTAVRMFSGITGIWPTPLEMYFCDMYRALRSQCVPDLTRLVAILTYLLYDLRSFEIPKLKNFFLQVVAQIISSFMVGLTFGIDRYIHLVADTVVCITQDVKFQLEKLLPILTKENVKEAGNRIADAAQNLDPADRPATPYRFAGATTLDSVAVAARKAEYEATNFSYRMLGKLTGILDKAINKVYSKSKLAKQDFMKILQSGGESFAELRVLMDDVLLVMGVLRMLQALLATVGQGEEFDPCSNEAAQSFINRVQIPNRRAIITRDSGSPDPDDAEVVLVGDTVTFENPVIRDILQEAGVEVLQIASDQVASSTEPASSTQFTVRAAPMTISVLKCFGPKASTI